MFTSSSRAGDTPATFRTHLDVVLDPMKTRTLRFLDPKLLLMLRCSELSCCLAKHGSDERMPKQLRMVVLCSQCCGTAGICCILHPHFNAEGFFPVRCVLAVIQRVSGSRALPGPHEVGRFGAHGIPKLVLR